MSAISKTDLIKQIAEESGISQAQAKQILETTLNAVISNVKKGNKIQLIGFGSFEKAHRKASKGRNPATGVEIKIPARDYPKFVAGKAFKEAVNG